MPTTVECKKGLISTACCGGGTSNQPGRFIAVDDGGGEVLVACPFTLVYKTTDLVVYDSNGNYKQIVLADTPFTDMDNIVEFLNACNTSKTNYERFLNVAVDYVEVSFELPDPADVTEAEIRRLLKVYSGSLLVDYDPGFTNSIGYQINKGVSPNRIEFFENRYTETVHVFY